MFAKIVTPIFLVAALAFFPACSKQYVGAEKETMLDRNWGKSVETAKYNQILNPEAGKTVEPVSGMDGEAGEKSVQKYRESFEKEAPQQSYSINLGNVSGIGQK
jgi:hypothetical protein